LYWVSRKLPKDLEYKTLTSSRASWFDMEVQKFCVLALVALAWNGIHAGCPRPSGWCSHEGTSFALKDCDGDGVPDPTCSDTEGKFGVISSNDYCCDSWPKGRCGSEVQSPWGRLDTTLCIGHCPRPTGWCSHEGTSFALKDCDGDGVPDPTCSDTEGKFGVISSNDYCSDSWPKGRCGSDACGDYGYIGCYVDDSMRDLNDGPKAYGYNQASCKEACKQYTYFALQHNGWCVCGNGYGTRPQYVKKPDSECGGASGLGGFARNSVYKRCSKGNQTTNPNTNTAGPAPSTGNCRDEIPSCLNNKIAGDCTKELYKNTACRKTCGTC